MPLFTRTCELVVRLAGVDLAPYKPTLVLRRLRAQARGAGFAEAGDYLRSLEEDADAARGAARQLVDGLWVGVSGFFRDPAVFEALERQVFPELLAAADGRLRVWSAACSRGQEAYSLAIALLSCRRDPRQPVALLGTDVDPLALEQARRGLYGQRDLEGVPPQVREAAFAPAGEGRWQVRPEVQRVVRFAPGDLLDFATHPSGLDLIACRNLLIYLRRSVQEDLLLALHRALRPGGVLLLGSSETVLGRPWDQFQHLSPAQRIYRKKP